MTKKKDDRDFLSSWLTSARAPDPSKLSRRTIKNDRWDNADLEKILKEMRDFDGARSRLCEVMEDTGNGMTADTFLSFFKVLPEALPTEQIRPDYMVNTIVRDEMYALPEYEELRGLGTVGDDVNAALAFITIRPEIEAIFDKVQTEQKLAQELMELAQELQKLEADEKSAEQLLQEMQDSIDPDADPDEAAEARMAAMREEQQSMEERIEELRKAMTAGEKALGEGLESKLPAIRAALQQGLDAAVEQAQDMKSLSTSWGIDPAALQKMNAAERIALAKRIKDNPVLQKLAKMIGAMVRLAFAEQRRKVDYARSEVHNVEQGNDLTRLVPQELLKIRHPMLKRDFRRRFLTKSLLQYKMRGTERVGLGGIIFEGDCSGSMQGDPEVWMKAVAGALLNVAKNQKRSFHGIYFGGDSDPLGEFNFERPEDYTPEKIMDFFEYFRGGGTSFEKPLTRALEILQAEFAATGVTKGDIVFVTDGWCGVSDAWLANFKAEEYRLGFQVFGVVVGGDIPDVLYQICDHRVTSVRRIVNGDDVRDVFAALHQP